MKLKLTTEQKIDRLVRDVLDLDAEGCQVTPLNANDVDSLIAALVELHTKAKATA